MCSEAAAAILSCWDVSVSQIYHTGSSASMLAPVRKWLMNALGHAVHGLETCGTVVLELFQMKGLL